jgi:hypothetical protein
LISTLRSTASASHEAQVGFHEVPLGAAAAGAAAVQAISAPVIATVVIRMIALPFYPRPIKARLLYSDAGFDRFLP